MLSGGKNNSDLQVWPQGDLINGAAESRSNEVEAANINSFIRIIKNPRDLLPRRKSTSEMQCFPSPSSSPAAIYCGETSGQYIYSGVPREVEEPWPPSSWHHSTRRGTRVREGDTVNGIFMSNFIRLFHKGNADKGLMVFKVSPGGWQRSACPAAP